MLDAEQVRALIVARIDSTAGSCNSYHIGHVMGQLRALVAVLNDGKPGPANSDDDLRRILREAKIPFRDQPDNRIDFPPDWLIEHGFEISGDSTDPNSKISHPVFSRSW